MNKKGEMSVRKAWLIVLLSLLDDIVVLALIFLGLWFFDVEITWWIVLIVLVFILVFMLIVHKAVIPTIRRRKLNGAEGMVGMIGKVTQPLKPKGMVKIRDEYWSATCIDSDAAIGEDVEVVGMKGLDLEVRKKQS